MNLASTPINFRPGSKLAGRLLSQRSDPVEIAFFLDDWTMVRRMPRNEKTTNFWQRLVAAARAIDTDPFRDAIRAQIGINDRATLRRLIDDEMTIGLQPARSLFLLAQVLRDFGYEKEEDVFTEKAHELIKRAWGLKPNDFSICSELGQPYGDESVRYSTAAVALKPGCRWCSLQSCCRPTCFPEPPGNGPHFQCDKTGKRARRRLLRVSSMSQSRSTASRLVSNLKNRYSISALRSPCCTSTENRTRPLLKSKKPNC